MHADVGVVSYFPITKVSSGCRLSAHVSGGLGDVDYPEAEDFVDELMRIVEGPLAIAFLYCLQSEMQDLWENVCHLSLRLSFLHLFKDGSLSCC
jgi:hypothetical protein